MLEVIAFKDDFARPLWAGWIAELITRSGKGVNAHLPQLAILACHIRTKAGGFLSTGPIQGGTMFSVGSATIGVESGQLELYLVPHVRAEYSHVVVPESQAMQLFKFTCLDSPAGTPQSVSLDQLVFTLLSTQSPAGITWHAVFEAQEQATRKRAGASILSGHEDFGSW